MPSCVLDTKFKDKNASKFNAISNNFNFFFLVKKKIASKDSFFDTFVCYSILMRKNIPRTIETWSKKSSIIVDSIKRQRWNCWTYALWILIPFSYNSISSNNLDNSICSIIIQYRKRIESSIKRYVSKYWLKVVDCTLYNMQENEAQEYTIFIRVLYIIF